MAKINSRAKGASGERECIEELKKHLPEEISSQIKRNLEQTRDGGHDLLGLRDWAIEVKRYAQIDPSDIRRFWEQTKEQARNGNRRPALIYRADRRDWRVVISAIQDPNPDLNETIEMSVGLFASIVMGFTINV